MNAYGTLWAWGNNQYSQLGQFAGTPPPLAVNPELAPLPVSALLRAHDLDNG
ncbi:hypothetical protein [Siccationidurans sp. BT442]|uniref:Chromosome condensation regulator RCC1 n=1 Tax=Hymenobacter negativus TaxID=2795026 RepID=A0ABS3QIX8_9BACT|nr:hypothetical protein [Hymenobacter negativus]